MEESLVQNETMECHSAASAPEAVNLKFKNFLTKCAEQSFGVAGEIQRLKGIIGQLEGIPSDNDSQNATEELLNLKNLELLGYLGRLLTLMCCIMNGESIGGSSLVLDIVKHRIVLEKIRPIESKFLNNIELFFKDIDARKQQSSEKTELPLPDDSDQSEDAEGCVNEQQTNKRSMLKHHMVELYADNQKLKDKNAKKMGNIRSLVITEIGTDLGDDPDEVSNDLPENKLRLKTKRRIEESNFIRLPKTKKEKGGNRSASESNTLGSILSGITAGRNRGNRIAAKGKKRQTKNASR